MISADFGRADEITDSKVDFPTDGKPTSPTSANTFNSSSIFALVLVHRFQQFRCRIPRRGKTDIPRPPRPPFATTSV